MTRANPLRPGDRSLAEGRILRLVDRGGWELAERRVGHAVVAVAACTEAGELVLVEQHRPPLGRAAVELPAGIAGDLADAADESVEDAARRELHEETGYEADEMVPLGRFASSAGMTSEEVDLFVATGVRRTGPGGGDESESIRVHLVPLARVEDAVADWQAAGLAVDAKVLAGAAALRRLRSGTSSPPSS